MLLLLPSELSCTFCAATGLPFTSRVITEIVLLSTPSAISATLGAALMLSLAQAATAQAEELVSQGAFHNGPHAPQHVVKGSAAVYKTGDGKYQLRFSDDFFSDQGPDVVVVLSEAPDARDDKTVSSHEYLDIGPRTALTGAQSFDLPADFDPGKHKSVVIWCDQYDVQFGTAPLAEK